jgi:hypothetical protein
MEIVKPVSRQSSTKSNKKSITRRPSEKFKNNVSPSDDIEPIKMDFSTCDTTNNCILDQFDANNLNETLYNYLLPNDDIKIIIKEKYDDNEPSIKLNLDYDHNNEIDVDNIEILTASNNADQVKELNVQKANEHETNDVAMVSTSSVSSSNSSTSSTIAPNAFKNLIMSKFNIPLGSLSSPSTTPIPDSKLTLKELAEKNFNTKIRFLLNNESGNHANRHRHIHHHRNYQNHLHNDLNESVDDPDSVSIPQIQPETSTFTPYSFFSLYTKASNEKSKRNKQTEQEKENLFQYNLNSENKIKVDELMNDEKFKDETNQNTNESNYNFMKFKPSAHRSTPNLSNLEDDHDGLLADENQNYPSNLELSSSDMQGTILNNQLMLASSVQNLTSSNMQSVDDKMGSLITTATGKTVIKNNKNTITANTNNSLNSNKHSQQRYKLLAEGEVNVCKLPNTKNVISKILNSKLLRRWKSHHIILTDTELYSTTVYFSSIKLLLFV